MSRRWVAAAAIAACAGGCDSILGIGGTTERSGDAGGPADAPLEMADAGAVPDGPMPTFTVGVTGTLSWVRGRSTSVPVTVTRTGGFDDDVTVSLVGAPTGVTAVPINVAPASTIGTLIVVVLDSAPLGPHVITLHGQAGSITTDVPLSVMVADPPGTFDSTFGSGGIAYPDCTRCSLDAVAIHGDGVIVGGSDGAGGWLVLRLTSAGQPDGSFGAGGIVDSSNLPMGAVRALAVGPAGQILAGGDTTDVAVTVARFTSVGALDATFGNGTVGDAGVPRGGLYVGTSGTVGGVEIQISGAVVLAIGAFPHGAVCRLDADGHGIDTGFASGGCFASNDPLIAATLGPADAILAVGSTGVVHLTRDGDAYPGFTNIEQPGQATASGDLTLKAVAAVEDTLLLAGTDGSSYALTRLTASGESDASFADGEAKGSIFGTSSFFSAVGVQTDGKVVAAGYGLDTKGENQSAVLRFGGNGAPDAEFGTAGAAHLPGNLRITALAVAPDGRIVVAATSVDFPAAIFVARLWP